MKIKKWVKEDGIVKRGSKVVVDRTIDLTLNKVLEIIDKRIEHYKWKSLEKKEIVVLERLKQELEEADK